MRNLACGVFGTIAGNLLYYLIYTVEVHGNSNSSMDYLELLIDKDGKFDLLVLVTLYIVFCMLCASLLVILRKLFKSWHISCAILVRDGIIFQFVAIPTLIAIVKFF